MLALSCVRFVIRCASAPQERFAGLERDFKLLAAGDVFVLLAALKCGRMKIEGVGDECAQVDHTFDVCRAGWTGSDLVHRAWPEAPAIRGSALAPNSGRTGGLERFRTAGTRSYSASGEGPRAIIRNLNSAIVRWHSAQQENRRPVRRFSHETILRQLIRPGNRSGVPSGSPSG
jgi:hypothetical protein